MSELKRIVIVGATGYIGSLLMGALKAGGYEVIGVSRSREGKGWRKFGEGCLEGADVVFNFAGKAIDCRWTLEVKRELVASRVEVSDKIVGWIREMDAEDRPEVYLCASGIGIEDGGGDDEVGNDAYGAEFLVKLCREWEASACMAEELGVRVVNLRFGAVMGRDSKPWKKMSLPYKMFIGGPLGDKNGYFAWIHERDAVEAMVHCMEREEVRGGVNFVANAVTQGELAKEMGKALGRPAFFPVPPFAMKLMLGEFADALMVSIDASSDKLDASGYEWKYKRIGEALEEITGVVKR